MPEVRILHTAGKLGGDELQWVIDLLDEELPERFSVSHRPLTADDFSYEPQRIELPGRLSHDVIVRVYLHPDEERKLTAQQHVEELTVKLNELLTFGTIHEVRHVRLCVYMGGDIYWPEYDG